MTAGRSSPRTRIIAVLLLAGALPVSLSLAAHFWLGDAPHVQNALHEWFELTGAFIAWGVAMLLLLRARHQRAGSHLLWVAAALVVMGLVDGLHSLAPFGAAWSWLRHGATLSGGLLFAMVWLPLPPGVAQRNRVFVLALAGAGLAGALAVWRWAGWLPAPFLPGGYSVWVKAANALGGLGFVAASLFFVRRYRRDPQADDLVFAGHTLLFGMASLLFGFAHVWAADWWVWHGVRLVAYAVVLIAGYEIIAGLYEQITRHSRESEDRVAARTADLAASEARFRTLYEQALAEITAREQAEEKLHNSQLAAVNLARDATAARAATEQANAQLLQEVAARKQAERQLVHDLEAMTRLQKLGTLTAQEGNLEPVLSEIVDAAIAISGADFGHIQLFDPAGGDLRIAAQRGFEPWWLEFWNSVAKGQGCCGTALERGERVLIEDVEQSPIFAGTPALDAQRKAGVRAVQSTPLVSRSGKPVGMFSTHYRSPRRPDDRALRLLDLLARQGADIIEHARAEELRQALAEQEKLRLGAAVEQASDAVIMIGLDGTIRYVNAAFESINRTTRHAVAGTSYFDLLASDPPAAAALREIVATGRPWHGPLTRSVRGGTTVELMTTVSPAKDPTGAIVGGLITEKDVTRENALQDQVRQAQKMEALGTLAGGITHDFNNILGTIVINAELALLDLDPANPARRPLPLILQAASRGRELVKQIITFSRHKAWEKKPAEIAPIVRDVMRFLRTTLPKDVSIEETVDASSGVVLADPSHIHQVLVNLCQNAALALREGGGRLHVDLAPVAVDEALTLRHPNLKPGPYARLRVTDTGCGMSKEVRERIFEPFFTTRGPGEGSGLGLAVVHGIVRTYDGEITVVSEPGKGSTFNVYLPRLEGETLTAGGDKEEGPQRGQERVLLAEDEDGQRKSLERGLEHLGYKVTAGADGRSALEAFKKDPASFDVVITDQIMPRMTGLELASEITSLRPGIPVILCTGFSEKVNEESSGKSGVREILMKPFTLREATRLIRKVVG